MIPKTAKAVQSLGTRAGIIVQVTGDDRRRLEAIVADRSAPQKHVWRANIILATADGCGTTEIIRRSDKSKPVVWAAWQARFMAEGVAGPLRDKTRKPGKVLNSVPAHVPAGKVIHAIVDNYAVHKHPKVRQWLARHPRLGLPLHPDLGLLAQRRGRLLRQAHQASTEARCVPLERRSPGGHQSIHRGDQRQPQTIRVDRRPQRVLAAARGKQA